MGSGYHGGTREEEGEGESSRSLGAERGAREPRGRPQPPGKDASAAYKARAQAGEKHCPTVAMDQTTLDAEDAAEAGHASSTVCPADAALPAVAALPSDAALLADTVRPEDAEHPEDAVSLSVNVQDPELAWPPAPHSCSRCQLFYWLGALLLLLGVVCGLIVLFTRILTPPALTIPTSTTQGTLEKTSNLTVTPVPLIGYPITTGQVRHVPFPGKSFLLKAPLCTVVGKTPSPSALARPRLTRPFSVSHSETSLRLNPLNLLCTYRTGERTTDGAPHFPTVPSRSPGLSSIQS